MRKAGFILILCTCLCGKIFAQARAATVQSVLILSSMKYMEWPPANSNGNLEVVVFGDSPAYDELVKIAKTQKVNDRSIVVNKISSLSALPPNCHVFFVTAEKTATLGKVLNNLNRQSVLIITEQEGALDQGSDMNFVERNGKISFELREKGLTDKNIKVSKTLSALAVR